MIVLSLCLLACLVQSGQSNEDWIKGVLDEDGTLIISPPGQAMGPYGGAYPIVSSGYPSSAPNSLRQSWWFVSVSHQEGKPSALKIVCYDVRLPKLSCEDYSLTVEDGPNEHKYCGDVKPFTLITDTDNVRTVLRNGPNGKAFVNCTAEAIYVGPNKEEITTPRPTRPSYLTDVSEEVDSEEHGALPGDKSTTCPCGWANKVTTRIVNGTVTAPNEFPFAAALVDRDSLWQFCGAAIITSWHALTATHCTIERWREGSPMALIVGEHDLNDDPHKGPSRVIDVHIVVEHQGYRPKTFVDDISLLILKQQIIFSANVGPACLPTHQMDLSRQYVKIIGWGATQWRGQGSDLLRKVDVRVVNRAECNYMYSSYVKKENPTHICTYAQKKASCQGDSGGPVVWVDPETNRYTLIGLVSFGRVCADLNPSVHTDVGAYLDWIQHFVSVSKPEAVMCYKKD